MDRDTAGVDSTRGDLLVPIEDHFGAEPLGIVMRPNPGGGVTATIVKSSDFPALVLESAAGQWIPGREETMHLGRVIVLSGGQIVFAPTRLLEHMSVVSSCPK